MLVFAAFLLLLLFCVMYCCGYYYCTRNTAHVAVPAPPGPDLQNFNRLPEHRISKSSIDLAAEAFGRDYAGRSINEIREYAALILKNGGEYYYDHVIAGDVSRAALSTMGYRSGGHIAVAGVHTHGCSDVDYIGEEFSLADKRWSQDNNIPLYLITPSGILKVVDPDGTERAIAVEPPLPRDPGYDGASGRIRKTLDRCSGGPGGRRPQ
ncbi:MAG: DUF4329 domain-containing protein [Oscillospiraceae bacterium]|nr:DUF4329 domain-containing protein [Oscillospiraceae bacterium]